MRAVLFLFYLCLSASAATIVIHGPVGNAIPVAGQAGDPFWVSSVTNHSAEQFTTNTISVQSGDLVKIAVAVYGTTAAESTNQLDGVDMTVAAYTNSYNNAQKGFYVAYKLAAASGNSSVIINNGSDPAEKAVLIEVFRNVNQTTPVGTAVVSDSVTATTGATNTCNSASGDLIYDAITWNVGTVGSVGSGQTRRGNDDPSADDASVASSTKASEGATSTMRESGWASGRIGHIVIAIKHQ